MLEKILNQTDCAKCKSCCTFQLHELIDAPTFTKNQIVLANKLNNKIQFIEKGEIFQIQLIPKNNVYVCPLLSENGCVMGAMKPFDCKIWPFYLMRLNGKFVITLSLDCPTVRERSIIDIAECISDDLISNCKYIITHYPNMVIDYNREMIILKILNNNTSEMQ